MYKTQAEKKKPNPMTEEQIKLVVDGVMMTDITALKNRKFELETKRSEFKKLLDPLLDTVVKDRSIVSGTALEDILIQMQTKIYVIKVLNTIAVLHKDKQVPLDYDAAEYIMEMLQDSRFKALKQYELMIVRDLIEVMKKAEDLI